MRKEDGAVFLTDFLDSGWLSIWEPYSGYLHVLPRALTGAGSVVPLEGLAVWIGLTTVLVKVGVCLLAYPVLLRWLGLANWAAAAAVVPLYTPLGSQEVLGNYTNLRWYMAYAAFFVAWSVYRNWAANLLIAGVGVVAVFTEPLVVVMLPLLALRAFVNRGWARIPSLITGVVAIVNITWVMQPGVRGGQGPLGLLTDPVATVQQALLRGPAAAELGANFSKFAMLRVGSWYWLVGALILGIVIWLSRYVSARSWPGLAFSWLLICWGLMVLLATMAFTDYEILDIDQWYTIGQTSRYSLSASLYLLTGFVGIAGLVLSDSTRRQPFSTRVLAWGLLAGLVAAVFVDFPGDEWNYRGPLWSETVREARAQCALGAESVVVPITPQGVPANWTATLPCEALES